MQRRRRRAPHRHAEWQTPALRRTRNHTSLGQDAHRTRVHNAAPDGLAMDTEGRLYIAANREGKIWRYDPATDEMLLIAEGMFGCASLAFGEGEFDRQSFYATTIFCRGGAAKCGVYQSVPRALACIVRIVVVHKQ